AGDARRRVDEAEQELLAANARQQIAGPRLDAEDLRDCAQHAVADAVAEAVVDALEQVEVGDRQAQRLAGFAGAREQTRQVFVDTAPVAEPRQLVFERVALQFGSARFELALFVLELAAAQALQLGFEARALAGDPRVLDVDAVDHQTRLGVALLRRALQLERVVGLAMLQRRLEAPCRLVSAVQRRVHAHARRLLVV